MESFEQIADQFTPMIYSIIRSLHIYKNKEEFFQTGLVALWEAANGYESGKGQFESYAYRYIKGRLMTELTKAAIHEEKMVYPDDEFWETAGESSIGDILSKQLILSYCDCLTPSQRKWVLYTCIHCLSIKEIAEKENVSISAVKIWRKEAKQRLKDNIHLT
ncbi:sigma-70 family RNA polymerase sigma factor [Bacillus sp. FJAT-27445]|uniref:sigma-70 family RNA polymerase sigma factor n=1 Tax=Bacillus sp. FJAT-27445 TaxID=1679166 RepID=UPI0007444596|nr:sigma-70 family RNA polymerase sigma factor [Bacillus sp. FJAT-27445]